MNAALQKAINAQIKHELDSAYVYLAMSAHFESQNMPGFGNWMRMQAREEVAHAMRLFQHLVDRGARVTLDALAKPRADFATPLEAFEAALEHEQKITGLIHSLYDLAVQKKDYATQIELQWFVTEQVEEEKSAGDVVNQLRLAGDSPTALLMLDRHLGSRSAEE